MAKTATPLTTADVATEFDTTPRNLRKFLRDDARGRDLPIVGKGSRWSIARKDLRSLRSRFAKWEKAQDEARIAREAAKALEAPEVTEVDEVDEVDAEMTLDDVDGPTDEEIAELDA